MYISAYPDRKLVTNVPVALIPKNKLTLFVAPEWFDDSSFPFEAWTRRASVKVDILYGNLQQHYKRQHIFECWKEKIYQCFYLKFQIPQEHSKKWSR